MVATRITILVVLLIGALQLGARSAKLLFAGDAMQHQGQLDAARQTDGSYDYSECFTALEPLISGADFAVVNLETPVGAKGPYTGYPCFYAPTAFAEALADAGFDLLLTANNHTLDRRAPGLKSTILELDSQLISHIGTYTNADERALVTPKVFTINGIAVAFLNYTYGTNGFTPTEGVVVDYIDPKQIEADVKLARQAGAEIVTVALHWGDEYQLTPNRAQKQLADKLVDLGVDLIIGGHPHVIQPVEIRHSDKYDKDILIVYSLGNFISNMNTRDTRGGAIVRADIERDAQGRARLTSADYILHFTEKPHRGHNYRVVPVTDAEGGAQAEQAREFAAKAREIYNRYNRGVAEHKP